MAEIRTELLAILSGRLLAVVFRLFVSSGLSEIFGYGRPIREQADFDRADLSTHACNYGAYPQQIILQPTEHQPIREFRKMRESALTHAELDSCRGLPLSTAESLAAFEPVSMILPAIPVIA